VKIRAIQPSELDDTPEGFVVKADVPLQRRYGPKSALKSWKHLRKFVAQ